jgi:hypothetical protein
MRCCYNASLTGFSLDLSLGRGAGVAGLDLVPRGLPAFQSTVDSRVVLQGISRNLPTHFYFGYPNNPTNLLI